jgi:acyl-CoA synthetase (AMP-forming)/AMP-acid ligase II
VIADIDADAPALIDDLSGDSLPYRELRRRVADLRSRMPQTKSLVAVALSHRVDAVVVYLAARSAGHAVMVVDPGGSQDWMESLADRYQPELFYRAGDPPGRPYQESETALFRRQGGAEGPLHRDLSVLLPTSGSTGSPKFVRLSRTNLASNTEAISASLAMSGRDRAVTSLPLSYSYGLSVLNTHLHVGGAVVLTSASVIEPSFWDTVRQHGVTSLAGVPYTYLMLKRVGFASMELPSITKLTQAGGRMADELVLSFAETLASRGGSLYVMYGQTEASPRMTCLPPDRLPEKVGSVGPALPGGRLGIRVGDAIGYGPGEEGEVVYCGPNVMMGYASERADLASGDVMDGVLPTGDIGHLDEERYLWLTGRSKRIAKLFGVRVSLDDIESLFHPCAPVAAVAAEDKLVIHHEQPDESVVKQCRSAAAKALRVPPSAIQTSFHPGGLPTHSNGKIDYRSLASTREHRG